MGICEIQNRRSLMPRRTLDRIVVVDVETTCREADQMGEIIEIGGCFMDLTDGERMDRES